MKGVTRAFLIVGLLLPALLVNVSQAVVSADEPGLRQFQDAPRGATIVKAFSKPDAFCQGLTEWVVETKPGNWIDVGIEWIAIDEATVLDNWPHVHFDITVDDLPVVFELPDFQHGPYTATVECPDFTLEGKGIGLEIYLPPMTPGDHTIEWTATIDEEISDGWFTYPAGTVSQFGATMRVVPPGLK